LSAKSACTLIVSTLKRHHGANGNAQVVSKIKLIMCNCFSLIVSINKMLLRISLKINAPGLKRHQKKGTTLVWSGAQCPCKNALTTKRDTPTIKFLGKGLTAQELRVFNAASGSSSEV
jgi:hypothetical protein